MNWFGVEIVKMNEGYSQDIHNILRQVDRKDC
jgi:hypothetical protein